MDGDIIEIYPWYPHGVQRIIATGSMNYIGVVDHNTVLKYPHIQGQPKGLDVEREIYIVLGSHPHIIKFKGDHDDGILLEWAQNGSVAEYLQCAEHPQPTTNQKLRWSQQCAEAIAYAHARNVIHRDINIKNPLLDQNLSIRLCDFQGLLKRPDGTVHLDGGSAENIKSFMPRQNASDANEKTDIFAMGTAIFHIMKGHLPFPELDPFDDDDEVEITKRYQNGLYDSLDVKLGGNVVHKCWAGRYNSAEEVAQDLTELF